MNTKLSYKICTGRVISITDTKSPDQGEPRSNAAGMTSTPDQSGPENNAYKGVFYTPLKLKNWSLTTRCSLELYLGHLFCFLGVGEESIFGGHNQHILNSNKKIPNSR